MALSLIYRRSRNISTFLFALTFSGISEFLIIPSFNRFPEKILIVNVNEAGTISVGPDIISSDGLAKYIYERLSKSYAGTGKMFDVIKLVADKSLEAAIIEIIKKKLQRGRNGH